MALIPVKIRLQGGSVHDAEVPDDEPVKDLIPQLVASLSLPEHGKDGVPLLYYLTSESLSKRLTDALSLQGQGVTKGDTLRITSETTAGGQTGR